MLSTKVVITSILGVEPTTF